jgi:hypothetical protein
MGYHRLSLIKLLMCAEVVGLYGLINGHAD